MNAIQETEKLLSALTRAEKAQLLQWIVPDLGDAFPGVESNPSICGGNPRIVRTRIPVPCQSPRIISYINNDVDLLWNLR